jgi:hypothetical protein
MDDITVLRREWPEYWAVWDKFDLGLITKNEAFDQLKHIISDKCREHRITVLN